MLKDDGVTQDWQGLQGNHKCCMVAAWNLPGLVTQVPRPHLPSALVLLVHAKSHSAIHLAMPYSAIAASTLDPTFSTAVTHV
jgi:hypothetical protein